MSTFKEIAEMARINEPTQTLGSINFCMMIAELAEAMDRLEYNIAVRLAHKEDDHQYLPEDVLKVLADNYVRLLREEVPENA